MTGLVRDIPQITMADVRLKAGEGMLSSDDVLNAANALLKDRWRADAGGGVREATEPQHLGTPVGFPVRFLRGGKLLICKCRDCAALAKPSDAVNASAEARLREALEFYADERNWIDTPSWDGDPACKTPKAIPTQSTEDSGRICDCGDTARNVIKELYDNAISQPAGVDEAKKSEGHDLNSLPSGESDLSVTTGFRPSDPTADRREIVDTHGVLNAAALSAARDEETLARRLFLLDEQPNSGAPIRMNCGWKQLKSWNRESYKKQARAILAALDGGR